MIHSPNSFNNQSWVCPKPGAGASSRALTWMQGPKELGHLALVSEAVSKELTPLRDGSTAGRGIA